MNNWEMKLKAWNFRIVKIVKNISKPLDKLIVKRVIIQNKKKSFKNWSIKFNHNESKINNCKTLFKV